MFKKAKLTQAGVNWYNDHYDGKPPIILTIDTVLIVNQSNPYSILLDLPKDDNYIVAWFSREYVVFVDNRGLTILDCDF